MFLKANQLAYSVVIGLAAFVAGGSTANAMPVTFGPQIVPTEIIPVRHMQNDTMTGQMYWRSDRDGNRCRTRYGSCRHYYQGFYYQTPWWTFPLIIGSIANNHHSRAHVQWCLNHYRSYNPRTDMWLGHSGNHYRCRSPY